MFNSKWPKDLWAPLLFMVIGLVFAIIFAAYVIYAYVDQFIVDVPDPSGDFHYFLESTSLATIPMFMLSISLFLFLRTRAQGIVANRLKLAFLTGTILMVAGSSIYIFLVNVYFRSDRWIDNIDLVNHLSFFGQLIEQLGLVICGIVGLLLIRSFLSGEMVGIRTRKQ